MIGKITYWIRSSLRRRSAFEIMAVMIILITGFIILDIQTQRVATEDALLQKGISMALSGAQTTSHILEDAIASGRLTEEQVFDRNYQQIPNTDPPKYHTAYDSFTDQNLQSIEDGYLQDADVVFAIAIDDKGYIPTHNTIFSKPLTGDPAKDLVGNRTKRIFNDETGQAAAQNTQKYLQQIYFRDTGEKMWDLSAPIMVNGKHWGGFRIGFSLVRVEEHLASITWRISIAGILLAAIVIFASYMITKPMTMMSGISTQAKKLSRGEAIEQMNIKRIDEVGVLVDSFNNIIDYNTKMAKSAGKMAEGDFTDQITVASEGDILGTAFVKMVGSLKEMIGEIRNNAIELQNNAIQLSQASHDAGSASEQIAQTVLQISTSTGETTDTITRSSQYMDQLDRAIDGVTSGAKDQADSVGIAVKLTNEINELIQEVTARADEVSRSSRHAAEAADIGSKTVEDTIKGMEIVREKVDITVRQMQEMGNRSNEIGSIIEKIEEIASQTNLLALNAAIEAARAGEHGKGFAVVADEVRKLAERAALSTREISGLVEGIQHTVKDTMSAMDEGATEVGNGVERARNAGSALDQISTTIREVLNQSTIAAEKSKLIQRSTQDLVESVESVSAVVEENLASAEEMSANSKEVSQSFAHVASISEQNYAAVEEVTASTQEVSTQVAEVSSLSNSLSQMANNLQNLVSRFKID